MKPWAHVCAYLTHYFRAKLPGRDLTGTATISGTTVTGIGTDFENETEVGKWLRFADLPGEAFQIATITGPLAMTVNESGSLAVAGSMTVLETDVHDQVLRAEQGDERIRISLTHLDLREFCQKRDVTFQALVSADSEKRARGIAGSVLAAFPEGGSVELQPPLGQTESLYILWRKLKNFIPLGETRSGRSEYSINFNFFGEDSQ